MCGDEKKNVGREKTKRSRRGIACVEDRAMQAGRACSLSVCSKQEAREAEADILRPGHLKIIIRCAGSVVED